MNEIEKLYENAIGKVCTNTIINPERCNKRRMTRCCGCDYFTYPPFTPEKQLEVIVFFMNNTKLLKIDYIVGKVTINIHAELLAKAVNNIWQDLTEEEHKQITEILR